jgi:ferredoxin-NADP reductase/CRP-like cAMP-binding protein
MSNSEVDILKNTLLFKHLDNAQIHHLLHQAIKQHYPSGSIILQEGEIGSCLYVILSGSVRVYSYDKDGIEIVLARLEEGDYFGEQALLSAKPLRRNASALALSDTTLLSFSYTVFQRQLKPNPILITLLQEQGEKQLVTKLFKQLESDRIDNKKLLALLTQKEYLRDRQIIFRQGNEAKKAYYLIQGLVEIRVYQEDGKISLRREIHPGQFFGERDVLEHTFYSEVAVALTDSEVFVIDEAALQEACKYHPALKTWMNSVTRIYQIANFGLMMQYQGIFLEHPAVCMTMQKQNGEIITASRVLHADIFAITYATIKHAQIYSFHDNLTHKTREIKVEDDCLVSAISIGEWEDLDEISRQVYEKAKIQSEQLTAFIQSGKLGIVSPCAKIREGIVCHCMQISYSQIDTLIQKGITKLEEISSKIGAGTVCGGCRPYLKELLGVNVWQYVKIKHIREHTERIRSYQLELLNQEISSYQAGQHVVIGASIDGHWVDRSYTLTSTATENMYEITVKREHNGLFSQWLFQHGHPGIILRISEPQGSFIFESHKKQPAVCLVAGIGVTPAISFARKVLAVSAPRLLYIDYSIRFTDDLVFKKELMRWPQRHSNIVTRVRITSREGHIQNEIHEIVKKYPNADFYICGPPGFENNVMQQLQQECIDMERIFLERFTHAASNY